MAAIQLGKLFNFPPNSVAGIVFPCESVFPQNLPTRFILQNFAQSLVFSLMETIWYHVMFFEYNLAQMALLYFNHVRNVCRNMNTWPRAGAPFPFSTSTLALPSPPRPSSSVDNCLEELLPYISSPGDKDLAAFVRVKIDSVVLIKYELHFRFANNAKPVLCLFCSGST